MDIKLSIFRATFSFSGAEPRPKARYKVGFVNPTTMFKLKIET